MTISGHETANKSSDGMSGTKLFLVVGAFVCALIGAYMAAMTAVNLSRHPIHGASDLLVCGCFVSCSLLAFVPFYVFVYPRLKTTQKSVSVAATVIEILVLAFVLWVIFFPSL